MFKIYLTHLYIIIFLQIQNQLYLCKHQVDEWTYAHPDHLRHSLAFILAVLNSALGCNIFSSLQFFFYFKLYSCILFVPFIIIICQVLPGTTSQYTTSMLRVCMLSEGRFSYQNDACIKTQQYYNIYKNSYF